MSITFRNGLVYLASVSVFAIVLAAAPMTFDFDTATMRSADAHATGTDNAGTCDDDTGNDGGDEPTL
ncbi:MAG: hypothetical protein WD715_02055 [Dongiaceae bacterium]